MHFNKKKNFKNNSLSLGRLLSKVTAPEDTIFSKGEKKADINQVM